jgi:hypothetical protein
MEVEEPSDQGQDQGRLRLQKPLGLCTGIIFLGLGLVRWVWVYSL